MRARRRTSLLEVERAEEQLMVLQGEERRRSLWLALLSDLFLLLPLKISSLYRSTDRQDVQGRCSIEEDERGKMVEFSPLSSSSSVLFSLAGKNSSARSVEIERKVRRFLEKRSRSHCMCLCVCEGSFVQVYVHLTFSGLSH